MPYTGYRASYPCFLQSVSIPLVFGFPAGRLSGLAVPVSVPMTGQSYLLALPTSGLPAGSVWTPQELRMFLHLCIPAPLAESPAD